MKKVLLALVMPAILFSCNKVGKDEFVLTGTVEGADGKEIVLQRQDDSLGIVSVDTVKIENGKFKFEGTILEPSMHALSIQTLPSKSYVIVENGEITIKINKDSTFLNKMGGTYNNEQLTEFSEKSMGIQKKMQQFQVQKQQEMMMAHQKKDTATVNRIRSEFMILKSEMDAHNADYIKKHPKAFISLLLITNMFATPTPEMDKIRTLYNGLDPELKKTKPGKSVAKKLAEASKVGVGQKAPGFSAADPNGNKVSLKESMGKLTIIDFWASWCGPCRKANPELVALYEEFHPKGLNIIGVSLDAEGTEAKWKAAIAADKLTWTQVSNLKKWDDPIAAAYDVTSIPQMFVVNNDGIIIAKDLRGAELRTKVSQLLASS
ncbi:MAG TPA: TlpA disulfide reductase family protein [Flavobacterium sp.]|jgi:thiol-disulfide isomerase/thioredoxin